LSVYALDAQVIFERLDGTRARSRATCDRSVSLLSASAAAHRQAQGIRQSVANERRAMLLARTPLFLVCGLVEDEPVEARWVLGYGLMCPSCLRECERSEVVVGLDETFSSGEGGPTVDGCTRSAARRHADRHARHDPGALPGDEHALGSVGGVRIYLCPPTLDLVGGADVLGVVRDSCLVSGVAAPVAWAATIAIRVSRRQGRMSGDPCESVECAETDVASERPM
jgi:hypothetical protein